MNSIETMLVKKAHWLLACLALSAVVLLQGCSGQGTEELPLYSKIYAKDHDPESDLEFVIEEAKGSDRRILLFVGGDWCPWCRALDTFLSKDQPEVGEYLHEHFVLMKVYYGPGNYNQSFLAGFPRLVGTPHFFVLESDGSLLHSQSTAELEKGRSYDTLKMMAFLKRWAPKN